MGGPDSGYQETEGEPAAVSGASSSFPGDELWWDHELVLPWTLALLGEPLWW